MAARRSWQCLRHERRPSDSCSASKKVVAVRSRESIHHTEILLRERWWFVSEVGCGEAGGGGGVLRGRTSPPHC